MKNLFHSTKRLHNTNRLHSTNRAHNAKRAYRVIERQGRKSLNSVIFSALSIAMIAVFAFGNTQQAFAYKRPVTVKHLLGLYVEGGEWSLLPYDSKLNSSMGAAGALGFAYDLQAGHFILNTGVGVNYGATYFGIDDWNTTLADQTDKEGDTFDYIYKLHARQDAYSNLAVQVPLLLGGQYKRFYALAGVKFTYNAMTRTSTVADLNTVGRYYGIDASGKKTAMFDDFTNMPEYQFYENYSLKQKAKSSFNVDLDVSVEIGARLGFMTDDTGYDVPKSRTQYRLALFADYGLLDLHTAGDKALITTPSTYNADDMLSGIQTNDILSTTKAAGSVKNLFIGVKFTILFELPQSGTCLMCRDGYRSSAKHRKGGGKIEL